MGFSYISDSGRKRLPQYAYKGKDRSLFYAYVSSPACDWLVEFIPKWVAPNLITFIGLLVMAAGHAVVVSHAPDLHGEIPAWVCVLQAIAGLGLNMSRIESRPSKRELGEYVFFVDVELPSPGSSAVLVTLETRLQPLCEHLADFGAYPSSELS